MGQSGVVLPSGKGCPSHVPGGVVSAGPLLFEESQIWKRYVEVSSSTPYLKQGQLLGVLWNEVVNISEDGDTVVSLGPC